MSRKPPSQRDPQYAEQRIMRANVQRVPGTGKSVNASPRSAKPREVVRGTAPASSAAPVLHVGTAAPTDGSVFWLDTDDVC